MINDILTVMWKEWREVILTRRGLRGGLVNIGLVLLVLGVFMPLQTGAQWLEDPRQLLIWSWVPIFIALSIITDSFAGERERHTLETLLASRLSDQAILYGKIAAVVLYAWSLATASMLVGAATINLAFPTGQIQFYSLKSVSAGLLICVLAALLVACIGVLVSLRAPTVRQAYQRMSVVLIAFWFVPIFVIQFMPDEMKSRLFGFLSGVNLDHVILGVGAVLAAADIVLLLAVKARFVRPRLILD